MSAAWRSKFRYSCHKILVHNWKGRSKKRKMRRKEERNKGRKKLEGREDRKDGRKQR